MTNQPDPGPIARRRLGAAMLAFGLILLGTGLALLVLDDNGDTTDEQVAATTGTSTTGTSTTSPTPVSQPPTASPTTPADTPAPTATSTPTPSPTPEPTPLPLTADDAAVFFDQLTLALTTGDTTFLLDHLHPDVTARYSEATCDAYLALVPLETSIQVRGIQGPAPWDWVTNDGAVATYDRAWSIDIERLAGSQTLLQVMHLAEVDGRVAWFTDCGDPAGS